MKRALILISAFQLFSFCAFGQTGHEPVTIDTRTHAVQNSVIDASSVTLTLGGITAKDTSGAVTWTLGSTNGTKLGATGDKIGFLGATPVTKPTGSILTALPLLGLVATPTVNFNELSGTATLAQLPTLDAAHIPSLDASKITTGVFAKAQQHAATAYTDAGNTFTGTNNFDASTGRGVTLTSLANPAAPLLSTSGTAGTTSRSYAIVAKLSDGTTATAASPAATITTSNATLNSSNYDVITWTAVTGATYYDVYRTASAGTPSTTGRIATNVTSTTYNDQGAAGNGATIPTINSTGAITAANIAFSVTPEQFGAVGDGIADDAPAFQKAVDYAASLGGAKINLSSKTYILGQSVTFSADAQMIGTGPRTVIRSSHAAGATFQVGTVGASTTYNVRISNMLIWPSVTRNSGTYEIDVQNGSQIVIDNISAQFFWGLIRIGTPSATNAVAWVDRIRAITFHQLIYMTRFLDAWVTNVSADSVNSDAVDVILDGGVESSNFTNCDFTGVGTTNLVLRAVDYAASPPRFNKFTACYFDNHSNGLLGSAGDTNSFANCWFSARPNSGVALSGTIANTRFDNCEAYNNGAHGYLVQSGAANTQFFGSAARSNVGDGYHISASTTGGVGITGGSADSNQTNLFIDTGVTNVTADGLRLASPTTNNIVNASSTAKSVSVSSPQNNDDQSWVSYTPSLGAPGGGTVFGTVTASYKLIGKTVHVRVAINITTYTGGGSSITATLPFTAAASEYDIPGVTVAARIGLHGYIGSGSTSMDIKNSTGGYPAATGDRIVMTGTYEVP